MRSLLRRDGALVALLVWTVLVWTSRVRNVLGNEDLDGAGRAVRLLVVAVFLGLAVAVLARWRRQDRGRWVRLLSGWTIGLWTFQMVSILLDDYDAGFVAIHAVLAAVSVVLAVGAWRSIGRGAAEPRVEATV